VKWTEAEERMLRKLYPHQPTKELAEQLGRPVANVYAKANNMGLKKSEAFQASASSGRILKGGLLSVATQFKPGQKSWSAGLKGVVGVQAGCRATQFKKGQRGNKWVPIGSTRINGDGVLDRKVAETGYGPNDWKAVHRLVWIAANGPVPDGHLIAFLPGRHTTVEADITLDALELVSRRDWIKRHTLHNYPKEIAQVIQLRGAITRQINKRTKETA
jgi:hypothetical protein